jgi:hypothetical protein
VSNTPARDDQNNIDHPPGFHPAKKGADRWLTTRRKEILQWGQAVLLGLCGLAGGVMIPKLYPEAMTTAGSMASENMASISGISNQVTRQPLLWERLLPNSTYPEGVVVSLILLTAPIVTLLVAFAIRSPWKPGLWRWLALAGVLTGFLAMGIVASVKIGGGSNLHNLDMFLIGLLFVCGLALEAGLKDWVLNPGKQPWWVRGLLLVIVIYPFFQGVLQAQPFGVAEPDVTNSELSKLQKIVSYYGRRGPILFIDQRQLLTFGSIQGIPLLPEYEKKRMMDEAMSGNEAYFKPFYSKVYNHSYALIVTEPLQTSLQNEASQFDKENNVWVKWVARPVLCFYAPYDILPNAGILLLRPRVGVLQDSRFSCPVVK